MIPNRGAMPSGDELRLRDMLRLAVWCGLLAGLADAAALGLRRLLVEPIVFADPRAVWTIPVADAALFALLAMAAWGAGVAIPSLRRPALTLWAFCFLGLFGALYNFPAVHRVAALLLSAGLALQVVRVSRGGARLTGAIARSTPWLLAGTAGLAIGMVGWQAIAERRAVGRLGAAPAGAPNVLLIVLDTVRAMNLSLYGYARETTPWLTRWARSGVTFTRAMSTAPWTLPSHASLMTGRQAHELSADWMVPLDTLDTTLAEALAARGWLPAGFVANTDYASAEVGLARGFIHYEDYTLSPGQIARSSSLARAIARVRPLRRLIGTEDNLGRKTAPDISQAFLSWVDRGHSRPFFAFLNYYDAHRPYLPPRAWAERFRTPGVALNPRVRKEHGEDRNPPAAITQGAVDAYDGSIAYLDHELGLLFEELARRGLLQNTIVVLTSDHGEEFMEHGVWDHGNSLYLNSVHVPLVVSWPGRVPADSVVATPVSIAAVPGTILELATGGSAMLPGGSLSTAWNSQTDGGAVLSSVRRVPRQPEWYPVSAGDMTATLVWPWRLIRTGGTDHRELYRIDTDPMERHDLSQTPAAALAPQELTGAAPSTLAP
ncbi:MAG: sulfatase-like hydrolase/transferase [Gemmatimonadota bacterium]|nr:sulfatase-like hydrolase/transferase [Gemmatimonadota bacterium]